MAEVERKAEVEIDPEAAMESPRAEGEETPVPPAWKEVYGGSRFEFKSLFPPFTWLPAYIRFAKGNATTGDTDRMGELPYSIKGDLIAGLTVGLMLVPQCLAFALLAGLPIRAGLYSSFAPLVIYALLGTLRQLQVGPTALISLLTGQALDAVNLLGENERLTGASTLALLVGLVSLLLGILRFGFVVDFMSHSVMSSFCTASGVIIATSQLKHVLGINIKRHKYWWETAYDLCSKLPEADAATAVLGFTLLAMLTFFKKWKQAGNQAKRSKSLIWRFFPKNKDSCAFKSMKICADLSSVLCVILGWVWGFIYREAGINSVRLINDSESDGFVFLLPSFDDKTPDLIVPAVMIAVVGFLETVAVGGKMANEKRYSYDANQELLALGAANVGGAFMGAFPITGGFSRTAVNAMFGASSPLAGALTSIIVVIAVYSLMPVVEMLPLAALAPLIIHGAIGVTDFKAFIPTFKGNKLDFLIMVFTFLVSLGLTVKEGLITGVSLSILKLTYEVAMPNLAVCAQVKDGTFRDVRYYPEGRMFPKCVVVRMDAGLSFANTRRLQEFCMRAMTAASKSDSSVSHLILDCKSVNGTDMTGCEAIESLAISLEKRKKSLVLANLKAPLTQEMALTQQYNQQLLQLNQQYHQQKAALEQQAMQLTMEYQQQRMQEEMAKKQAELQKEHTEVQARFHQDLQKLHGPGVPQEPTGMGPNSVYAAPMAPQGGGSWVPPPMPNGAYMPPLNVGGGSYVPPVGAGGPPGGSYVPPPDLLQASGGGSYVPPPNLGGGGGSYVPPVQMPTVMQPQVPSYATMPGMAAPPTTYGPVPSAYSPGTNYPPTTVQAQ